MATSVSGVTWLCTEERATTRSLHQELPLADWLSIRDYEPERQEKGKILWHLRKNTSGKLKNIITVEIYEAHTFFDQRY